MAKSRTKKAKDVVEKNETEQLHLANSQIQKLGDYQGDPDFMASLARGLTVISAFSEHHHNQTISNISKLTGLSRASVRRCLYTLVQLGYARQENNGFSLEPKILTLGYAFLSSTSIIDKAQPYLDRLRNTLHESSSIGVLEGDQVFYVGRSEATRVMSISLRIGSHLPAYCTSMGRVILANLPEEERDRLIKDMEIKAYTDKTVTSKKELLKILIQIKKAGYSIVDEELEKGLRSIAVPIFNNNDQVVAAINIGTHIGRVTISDLKGKFLKELQKEVSDLMIHNKYIK